MLDALKPAKILSAAVKALDGKNPTRALTVLNLVLPQAIPFNRPLGLKIRRWTLEQSEVELPFRRANKNHLGGLHACALATVGEYCAGIVILRRIDPSRQRLVLKELKVDFLKQGRATAVATAHWPSSALQNVEAFRASKDTAEIEMLTVISDKATGAKLAHVHTHWQIKPWSQVKGPRT